MTNVPMEQPNAERRALHIEIDDSMQSLVNTVNQLRNLLEEIKGENGIGSEKIGSEPKDSPCLHVVLNRTGDRVHNECDTMQCLIREIKEAIF